MPTRVHTRTRIKICGLSREADVDAAVAAGADAVGFVLVQASPRGISAARAGELARRLPAFVTPVLLFADADPALIEAGLAAVPQAMLQFHGAEPDADCARWGRPYLRSVRMAPGVNLLDWARRHPAACGLVLDTGAASSQGLYGGTGKVFDWSLVPAHVPAQLVLSGGLDAANVGSGMARLRPWAVDVSSGVEAAKGVKDPARIAAFCAAVRAGDAALTEAQAATGI